MSGLVILPPHHKPKHRWEVDFWVTFLVWLHLQLLILLLRHCGFLQLKAKGWRFLELLSESKLRGWLTVEYIHLIFECGWLNLINYDLYRNGQISMEMTLTNRAMQAMTGFAVQFNKNSFGVIPAQPLQVPSPLTPNQSCDVSLLLNTSGPVQKMDPLNNLQVWHCRIISRAFNYFPYLQKLDD